MIINIIFALFLIALLLSALRKEKKKSKYNQWSATLTENTICEERIRKALKETIKNDLKSSYENNGYYELSEDFVSKFDTVITSKYAYAYNIITTYENLKNNGKLLKIINVLVQKCIIELKSIHKKTLYSFTDDQIREVFASEVLDSVFSENNKIPGLSLMYVEQNNYKETPKSYQKIIKEYAQDELKATIPLENKSDADDLKEIIDSYILEQNEIINSDDYSLEEAIINAKDIFNNADEILDCTEGLPTVNIPMNIVPTGYELTDYFPIFKPAKFLNSDNSNYDYMLNEWLHTLKYDKYISNLKKILNYHIKKTNALIKIKSIINEKYEQGDFNDAIKIYTDKNFSLEHSIKNIVKTFLNNIDFPKYLKFKWNINYDTKSQILLIDIDIPTSDKFPCYKNCKRITKNSKKFEFNLLTSKEIEDIYQNYIYSLVLNIIEIIFSIETPLKETHQAFNHSINSIAINGNVKYIDDSDGIEKESCILSLLTTKKDFSKLNLSNVNYKKCFKYLKGVSSATLSENIAITPIITFNKNDKRFIEGKNILNTLDSSINIAAMDWQDFENLVRDIFEKEFCSEGSEVKITQSSHDGGVDAIVFDPDPIKGGKIVIQAKRYTNVVNVSAVRDLYGTVMNEGANKGILVTTSNFGADSYNFAKDKPITLINGNQLLYLLEKHHVNAKIDIKEAKKILTLQNSNASY